MENIRRYFKRTDKTYLLLCIFSSVMAVTALSSWAAKQGNGFAVDEITGQITGLGDYRRAAVQAGAALIGLVIAVLLSNIDYRSRVKVWPVHVALTWGMVLPTLVLRNVSIGPLTIGYNAGDTDNYSWYKLGGFTLQPTELAKISFILTFAMHLNNVRTRLNEPKELGKLLLHLAVPILIIHVQGDDGTAIIYAIIGCCMMFAAGLSWKYILGAVSAAASGTSAAMAASLAMLLLRSVPLRHTAAPPKTIQAHAATDTTCCHCRCTTRRRFFTGASAARIRSSSTWPMASNNSRSVTVQHPFPVSRRPACRACGAASPAPCSRSGRTARQCPPSRRSTSTDAKICCAFPPAACAETR